MMFSSVRYCIYILTLAIALDIGFFLCKAEYRGAVIPLLIAMAVLIIAGLLLSGAEYFIYKTNNINTVSHKTKRDY